MKLFLSHLMFSMQSAQSSRTTFERLGFQVTPLRKNAVMGDSEETPAGSCLVLFPSEHQTPGNYIELSNLGNGDAPSFMRKILSGPPAAKMLCAYTDQMANVLEMWDRLGVEVPYQFEAQSDDKALGRNAFKISIPKLHSLPVFMDVIEFETINTYKSKEFMHHPNGAVFLKDVYCLLPNDDVEMVGAHYAAMLDTEPLMLEPQRGYVRIRSGNVALHFLDMDAALSLGADDNITANKTPKIIGIGIETKNIHGTRNILLQNTVNFREKNNQVIVSPSNALESFIIFKQDDLYHV
ncbi:MAG: hypothetical protein AAGC95_09295 [Pseudomonadota bacterium]